MLTCITNAEAPFCFVCPYRVSEDGDAAVQLPEAVIVRVLQHLPLQQRLTCTLVGRSWAAAAAASTTAIDVNIQDAYSRKKCKSMVKWMQQHGQQLTSIKAIQPSSIESPDTGMVVCWQRGDMVIPCGIATQLSSLVLYGFRLNLDLGDAVLPEGKRSFFPPSAPDYRFGPDSDGSGSDDGFGYDVDDLYMPDKQLGAAAAAAAAGEAPSSNAAQAPAAAPLLPLLQELQLERCQPTVRTFMLLPSLKALTKLQFVDVDYSYLKLGRPPTGHPFGDDIMPQILQQLTLLQDLEISGSLREGNAAPGLRDGSLDGLSSLQRLQRLRLEVPRELDHSVFSRLPPSLTALELQGAPGGDGWLDIRDQPLFLQGLTSLQHLWLRSILIPTSRLTVLTSSSSLTSLHVENVVGHPWMDGLGLMGALLELKSLRNLNVADNFWRTPWPPQMFCALTAASDHTALHIWDRSEQPLPQGALQHMFPAGKQLPQLQVLHIFSLQNFYSEEQLQKTFTGASPPWCVDSKDITRMAETCPGLQELELRHVVKRSMAVGCLADLRLCSLRTLRLAGAAFKAAAVKPILQLTGLQQLEWTDSPLTDAGLKQLTELTGLTRLRVERCPKLTVKLGSMPQWQEWRGFERFPDSGALLDTGKVSAESAGGSCVVQMSKSFRNSKVMTDLGSLCVTYAVGVLGAALPTAAL